MLYSDRVIDYTGLKVAAVQVTVEQNNIKKNVENVEKMAMSQQNRWS